MSFLSSAARQLAPGILLMVTLMPICDSASATRMHAGSLTVAPPRSNDSVVSNPSAMPASFMRARAFGMSWVYPVACGHAVPLARLSLSPHIFVDRLYRAVSMIFSYGIAYATAWRTFSLLKGGLLTFMPKYHSAF